MIGNTRYYYVYLERELGTLLLLFQLCIFFYYLAVVGVQYNYFEHVIYIYICINSFVIT